MAGPQVLPFCNYRSATPGAYPGDSTHRALLDGEIFLNTADRLMFYLASDGSLQHYALANLSQLDSPAFTGTPTVPTPPLNDATQRIANMAALANAVNALQITLNNMSNSITSQVAAAVAQIEGGAPGSLSTLKELADAIGDNASYAASITNLLANRLRIDAGQGLTTAQQNQGLNNLGINRSSTTSNNTVNINDLSQGTFTSLVDITFIATSAFVFIAGQADFSNKTASTWDVLSRIQLVDNTSAYALEGIENDISVPPSLAYGGNVSPHYALTGMIPGRSYTASLQAMKNSNAGQITCPHSSLHVICMA